MSYVMAGFSAYSAIQQGNTANALAKVQGEALDYQAQVEHQSALETARIIRKAGRRQQGAANAAYAASGVQVGNGSAAETERQIGLDTEHDAFQALLDGNRRARGMQTDAAAARAGGRMQRAAGYVNAATTLASGYYQGNKAGWRTSSGWDAGGYNGTNDRGALSTGNSMDWWLRNGRGAD